MSYFHSTSVEPVVEKMLQLYFTPGGAAPTEKRMRDPVYRAAFESDRQQYCDMRQRLRCENPAMLAAVDRAVKKEMTYPHEEPGAAQAWIKEKK